MTDAVPPCLLQEEEVSSSSYRFEFLPPSLDLYTVQITTPGLVLAGGRTSGLPLQTYPYPLTHTLSRSYSVTLSHTHINHTHTPGRDARSLAGVAHTLCCLLIHPAVVGHRSIFRSLCVRSPRPAACALCPVRQSTRGEETANEERAAQSIGTFASPPSLKRFVAVPPRGVVAEMYASPSRSTWKLE